MYPLSVQLLNGAGFACANDEAEHATLSAVGYLPAFVPTAKAKRSAAVPADANAITAE